MATAEQIKDRVDLHELATRLGLERPNGQGNYKSPAHKDKHPSLSVFRRDGVMLFKDHSTDEAGDAIKLVQYVRQVDFHQAMNWLHDEYGLERDPIPRANGPAKPKTKEEWIADRCKGGREQIVEYLGGRGIEEPAIDRALRAGTIGWNDWHSDSRPVGQVGHGGPGVAFFVRCPSTNQVLSVDTRYEDPDLNGGVKTNTQGPKDAPWCLDWRAFRQARDVVIVESSINAMTVETCGMPYTSAVALRGTANAKTLDVRPFIGKRVTICMDNDEPFPVGHRMAGQRPGANAAWTLYERLTAANIAALLVNWEKWEPGEDLNDILQRGDTNKVKVALRNVEPWAIPGFSADHNYPDHGKARVHLPSHDFAQYWRFRVMEDFTRWVSKREEDDDTGESKMDYEDLCGFRIAGINRVTIASAQSALGGDADSQPETIFSVSVQAPRHGAKLQRKVFKDEHLHNIDQWRKFGPIFRPAQFARLVTILERSAHLGARHAVNFVGLAWRDGRPIVNEGADSYFTEPEKQCPYHSLVFPSGTPGHAREVIDAYQGTFKENAALIPLVWALGGHLKAFLGFWPHMIMQAQKASGKSILSKRLERTIGMQMLSGQSLNTEFRLLTSISHTSHPIGWEELSARRQDVIDKAVAMLQEAYQFTVTRRGSEMTEFVASAPVLLAGEDVPVKSLLGKVVRTDLSGKKGPMMREDLPQFPVAEWLKFLTKLTREQVQSTFQQMNARLLEKCRAPESDAGAVRMAGNYAAVLTAWKLLSEFAGVEWTQGDFVRDVVAEMNSHISETKADREPWVWILEMLFSEIDAHRFVHPYKFETIMDPVHGERRALLVRTGHVMDHIAHSNHLKEKFHALPVKSHSILKRQLVQAGVLIEPEKGHERRIDYKRVAHMVALDLDILETYGLHVSERVEGYGGPSDS